MPQDGDQPREHSILTWPRVISGGFLLICATAGATWYIRNDRLEELEHRIASYESLQGADLPGLIKQLSKLTGETSAVLRLKDLEVEHSKLLADFEKIKEQNRELLRNITLEEEFSLEPGKS